jgi:plasmid stabilization system protein ParE
VDYEVILSPNALVNLDEITAYIARDNPARAESFGNELLDRIAPLARFPAMGSVTRRNPRWRKLVSPPYVITYRIDPQLKRIAILTFRHGNRRPLS